MLIGEKILLGITLSAPIGPVSLEMIKRGLNKGFLDAFVIRLGGAMGNTLCLMAAYFGLGMMTSNTLLTTCSALGSLVLIYLGIKSLRDKRLSIVSPDETAAPIHYSIRNGLGTGFVLSIANPIGIMFWLSIFAATIDHTQEQQTWIGLLQNFAVIGGVLIWGFSLSCFLEMGKRFFNIKLIRVITLLAGIMLIVFGLKYGYKAVLLMTGS